MPPIKINGDKSVSIMGWFALLIALFQILIPIGVYLISLGNFKGKVETMLINQDAIIKELKEVEKCHDVEINKILQIQMVQAEKISNLEKKCNK